VQRRKAAKGKFFFAALRLCAHSFLLRSLRKFLQQAQYNQKNRLKSRFRHKNLHVESLVEKTGKRKKK
jgi:hypothetical protein